MGLGLAEKRGHLMQPIIACGSCLHLKFDEPRVCDAFPEGIPDEILGGKNDHREPYPGDNSIQYETDTSLSPAAQ